MTTSDLLHQLIQTLTKNEKIYFKRFAALHLYRGKNNYIKLFDAISAQKKYDEPEIRKKLKNESFISFLSREKTYLYDLILKSLRSYDTNSPFVEGKISDNLRNVHILFRKGQYAQCRKIINKSLDIAKRYELYVYELKLLEYKMSLPAVQGFASNSSHQTNLLFNDAHLLLNKYDSFLKHLQQQYLIYGSFTEKKNNENNNGIIIPKITKTAILKKSFLLQITKLHYQVAKYEQIGNYVKVFEYTEKIIILFDKHPHQISQRPNTYFSAIMGNVHSSICKRDYSAALKIIENIKKITTASDFLQNKIQLNSHIFKIRICIESGNFQKEEILVSDATNFISSKATDRLSSTDLFILYYNIAYLYFGKGKYDLANKFLQKIFMFEKNIYRFDFIYFAYLLHVIIYFETGKTDLLKREILFLTRFFKKQRHVDPIKQLIFEFLKKISKNTSKDVSVKKEFVNLKSNISKALKKESKEYLLYFNVLAWVESKISNTSFAETMSKRLMR